MSLVSLIKLLAVCLPLLQVSIVKAAFPPKIVSLSTALESNCQGKPEEVTFSLLENAHLEYRDLKPAKAAELEDIAIGQIMIDFAFTPMQKTKNLLGTDRAKKAFIKRLITSYCTFRKAYVQGKLIEGYVPKIPKLNHVVDIALGDKYGTLTLEDFYAAEREYNNWKKMFDRIRKDLDVYSEEKDYKRIWDLFSWSPVKFLKEKIFPLLSPKQDPNALLDEYRGLLKKAGFTLKVAQPPKNTTKRPTSSGPEIPTW